VGEGEDGVIGWAGLFFHDGDLWGRGGVFGHIGDRHSQQSSDDGSVCFVRTVLSVRGKYRKRKKDSSWHGKRLGHSMHRQERVSR